MRNIQTLKTKDTIEMQNKNKYKKQKLLKIAQEELG